ncbi:Stk1 family PASTA domain-containing Ser/Thr kinase [Mediannikoviicoccus vaginalis]|uniref:Stk1 family PASTA domain-containing Ser/Thr kinase n=1 Tax=Mediannikoviicoccus vaginalis TaxID=2899727 RepID=UPI001F000D44|nr:Stk1 family PASTA domain-containing Ser/Thr kinase [Mediannikoviicoccus vaginalis]
MIGQTLGNRYLIEENIGVGGMAVVYKAKDKLLNRYVAIKVLKDEFMDDEEFLKKFAMEAQSAASLSHNNIVSVYDVGNAVVNDQRYNYIVMEYIDGRTLKDIINNEAPLGAEFVANIGFQIASALEAAHKKGVVHRDIKPHNILLDKDNVAKVTDFGIARISSSATITYTSTVLGTVHYISPEQAKGKFIDKKSDIYSLGVVLYEMATGRVPFDAENAVGIALKHIQDKLVEPKSLNPDIPQGLNDIILKAMDKDPNNRFSSATEMKMALLNFRNFKLEYDDNFDKTERIGVIKEEDIKPKTEEKAVYNMKNEYEDEEEEKKGGFFKTYILPILLALIVVAASVVGVKYFKGNLIKEDVVKTPPLIGIDVDSAQEQLDELDFDLKVKVMGTVESDQKEGLIAEQDPESGTELKKGSIIEVYVSGGEEDIVLKSYTNWKKNDAISSLESLGLQVEIKDSFSDNFDEGYIISQKPGAGESVKKNSTVELVVSKGKEDDTVPMINVAGMNVRKATEKLAEIGLKYNIEETSSSTIDKGVVISQSVDNGVMVKKGSVINLQVSTGEKEEPTEEPTEPKTNKKTTSYTFRIRVADISPGTYNVRIERIDGDKEVNVYNRQLDTARGDANITINVRRGESYNVYVNDELYSGETIE